ncbi:sulfite exporter TauE/SafE family protein [Candidatus Woesearchaeota archaeon]|jgi:uncharacterized membrane protein YfcA|nr:sulfite exporter TauE/SafE family protein [Candidatus Woesearchaeota archaeon]MBT4336072.1 sulfite exporter TauE/SafE family protein [Candidatus Woesearchaeota archaeon]MBT4468949.1 sulfite exporter TauE/SafE family protein [Candidatus Woesearchaeota archaeon]MBT6744732.1 sulfite exporter TauE/SafE family protein [Candidatus Woesearchaeota archaeon]
MDIITLLIVFVIGFFARLLSNLAGGGAGLIEAPLLLMLGVPPKMTVATRKFSAIGGHGIAAYQFHKFKKIHWKVAIILAVITVFATIIGANILISVNEDLVKNLIAIMMLVALPFTFFKKSFGMKRKIFSKSKEIIGYVVNFFIFIIDSFIGVGGGLLSSLSIIIFMGLTYLEVNAIRRITGLTLAIVGSIIFAFYGLIDWVVGFSLMMGGILGGYLGANIAIKKGSALVKVVFTIVVVVSVIKLLFF